MSKQIAESSEVNDRIIDRCLQLIKMIFVSLPDAGEIFKNNYEQMMQCKNMFDLVMVYSPLIWKYMRNKDIKEEDKFKVFRMMAMSSDEKRKIFEQFKLEDILDEKIYAYLISTCIQKLHSINTTEPTAEEVELYKMMKTSIEALDKVQTIPIEKLLDPEYFPELEERKNEEKRKREELCNKVESVLLQATSEQLKQFIEIVGKMNNDWEMTFDINSLSDDKLNEIIELYERMSKN